MLTRDFLMKADCTTAFGAIEESLLWSAEQRAASLAATKSAETQALPPGAAGAATTHQLRSALRPIFSARRSRQAQIDGLT